MSGHVDTRLPEGFLHERLMETQRPAGAQQYGSLVDFYKEPLHELCSSFYWKPPAEARKKSSSLKSNRSPAPNGEKKIVRFADVLGLDLADVHTFLDEIPRIPKSAFKDLTDMDRPSSATNSPQMPRRQSTVKADKKLVPLFQQPTSKPDFFDRLTRQKICLENAFVTHTNSLNIRGTVRVVNVDYHKIVSLRYTADKWRSFKDVPCSYLESCNDSGFSDRFNFTLPANDIVPGDRLEIALYYKVANDEYWDSNNGVNYGFHCVDEELAKTGVAVSQPFRGNDTWSTSNHSWAY